MKKWINYLFSQAYSQVDYIFAFYQTNIKVRAKKNNFIKTVLLELQADHNYTIKNNLLISKNKLN